MNKLEYNRLKVALAEKKITNKKLAEHLGKTNQTVSNWVRNDSQPSIETLYSIAKFLRVSVCSLLVNADKIE